LSLPVYACFEHLSDPDRVHSLGWSLSLEECERLAEGNPHAAVVKLDPPGPGYTQRSDGAWERDSA
jgi:hypothetical protein